MNLKHFFYREYYTDPISLDRWIENGEFEQPDAKRENENIKNENERSFKNKNLAFTIFSLSDTASDILDASNWPGVYSKKLTTQYPGLFSGSGYGHETGNRGELKLGFFFDHTTGLPILPGSSVKGMLRSVFPRFKKDDNDALIPKVVEASKSLQDSKARFVAKLFGLDPSNYTDVHLLELALFEGVDIQGTFAKRMKVEEGAEKEIDMEACYRPVSQHLIFLDAFISKGDKQSRILGMDAITPHGSSPFKNPIPIPFLKVLPNVEFTFQFLIRNQIKISAERCFEPSFIVEKFNDILKMFGVGAKTNVGYGQLLDLSEKTNNGSPMNIKKQALELVNYTKKIKKGESLMGRIVSSGAMKKVELLIHGSEVMVPISGKIPEVGSFVDVTISGIDPKTGAITQVALSGIRR